MRLIVVSNRLPITITEEKGEFKIKESVGGLVTGLSSYLSTIRESSLDRSEFIWVGWPGISAAGHKQEILREKSESMNLVPVFPSEKVMDRFYYGFCNKTIWPLFHYFTTYTVYDEEYWKNYKFVNELFCEQVLKAAKPDDIIWIHDYHLMLLPAMLRKKLPEAKIGFFLHIPFPSYEVFRTLPGPWREEILEGLLGADICGFHTYDYTKYFLGCVLRILGHENNLGVIAMPERVVKADTFPMGINFYEFLEALKSAEAVKEIKTLKKEFGDSRLILSIDRLDYTKGIINRLKGYHEFLEKYPQWHGKVHLLMVVVPSRVGVDRYNQMKKEIDEKVGNLNGAFGTMHWTPVIYQYRFIPFYPLAGLYRACDISLVTPLRDGMNLISKEYLACRTDDTGVLILSEMAGASKELNESLIVNPNNPSEIAQAIKDALDMPVSEQVRRNSFMRNRLKRYNVVKWANDFINELKEIKGIQSELNARLLDDENRKNLKRNFCKLGKKLLLLDYDGTLVPFAGRPEEAGPGPELIDMLKRLSALNGVHLSIISGRDRNTIEKWLGKIKATLIAEHGAWLRNPGKRWEMLRKLNQDWKRSLLPLLENYSDLLPGSIIEEKDYSLVWHFRKADPEQASQIARELLDDLVNFTANMNVQILQGSKVIEIRNTGINKGTLANHLLSANDYDFILAIGDDVTDEDMFRSLPPSAYTIKVGMKTSYAKYNLQNYIEVRKLLGDLINE
jgi:trehalose 6-phosphate synthase/phosphatase